MGKPIEKRFSDLQGDHDGWSDWIHPLTDYQMACCDCGLVHNIQFRIDDMNQLNFRVSRNVESTAELRRGKPTGSKPGLSGGNRRT